MEEKSLGNAFPESLQQETDVGHVLHHLLGGSSLTGVEVAHRGGKKNVVERLGNLFGADYAERAYQLGQIVLFLHGSVLLCVGFCFGKPDGKLAVFILCADFQTAALKACLSLFHAEQFRIHVPLVVHIHEGVRIVRFQPEYGVHGLAELLAVNGTAYPLLPTEKECTVIAYYQLASFNAIYKFIDFPCVFGTEPLNKASGNISMSCPCTLFIKVFTTFPDDNRLKISRSRYHGFGMMCIASHFSLILFLATSKYALTLF